MVDISTRAQIIWRQAVCQLAHDVLIAVMAPALRHLARYCTSIFAKYVCGTASMACLHGRRCNLPLGWMYIFAKQDTSSRHIAGAVCYCAYSSLIAILHLVHTLWGALPTGDFFKASRSVASSVHTPHPANKQGRFLQCYIFLHALLEMKLLWILGSFHMMLWVHVFESRAIML